MEAGSIVILVIWLAISLASSVSKKKKQEQKRQAAAAAMQQDAAAEAPKASVARERSRTARKVADDRFPELTNVQSSAAQDDRFPDLKPRAKQAQKKPVGQTIMQSSMDFSAEGSAFGGSLEGTAAERKTLYSQIDADIGKNAPHVVKPATESMHAHMESSMTGIQGDCAPETRHNANAPDAPDAPTAPDTTQAYVIPAAWRAKERVFAFDRASIVQGFLYGEVLGKPKALRR